MVGIFFQTEGMPRTAGRLLGLMIFDGDAISFSELSKRLRVSRGSISTSSRLLLQAGLIKRTSKPGERQDYFQLADNPYRALIETQISRFQCAHNDVAKTIDAVPQDNRDICQRLGDFCNFFRSMEGGLTSLINSKPGS